MIAQTMVHNPDSFDHQQLEIDQEIPDEFKKLAQSQSFSAAIAKSLLDLDKKDLRFIHWSWMSEISRRWIGWPTIYVNFVPNISKEWNSLGATAWRLSAIVAATWNRST